MVSCSTKICQPVSDAICSSTGSISLPWMSAVTWFWLVFHVSVLAAEAGRAHRRSSRKMEDRRWKMGDGASRVCGPAARAQVELNGLDKLNGLNRRHNPFRVEGF